MVTKQRWLLFPDCHIQCSSHPAFRLYKGKDCVCLVESFVPRATGELGGESRCSMHVCWVDEWRKSKSLHTCKFLSKIYHTLVRKVVLLHWIFSPSWPRYPVGSVPNLTPVPDFLLKSVDYHNRNNSLRLLRTFIISSPFRSTCPSLSVISPLLISPF